MYLPKKKLKFKQANQILQNFCIYPCYSLTDLLYQGGGGGVFNKDPKSNLNLSWT